tara:strand:+ start:2194 stop:3081 length:888 start_codon:yes stop_codon:yes gene_type:complete
MSSLSASVSAPSSSDSTGIVRNSNFDLGNIQFGAPKVNASGGKNVPIYNAAAKKGLTLQTPLMLTWGVNEWTDDNSGRKSYDMSLQFPTEEYANDNTRQFLENMISLENHIKDTAVNNSKEWFNKAKMSPEVIDALWTPMLRYTKNKETGEPDKTKMPTMKIKLPYYDQKFEFELYDNNGESIFNAHLNDNHPSELIPKASNVAIVVQCGGIWFANGKFGVTWRLVQGLVKPRASLKGKCHIQLDANEQSTLNHQVVADEEAVTDVPDSDEEPAAEPVPAPVKKVKKVVKKKSST